VVYDPSADPIAKRVLDNIEAQLRTITPPAYGANLAVSEKQVRQGDSNVQKCTGDGPFAIVVLQHEQHDDSVSLIQSTDAFVTVLFGVKARAAADLVEDAQRLLADARVALLADESRGGVAVSTSVLDTVIFDAPNEQRFRQAQMDLLVHYRTLYADPTASY
jgi:hypothetical protein